MDALKKNQYRINPERKRLLQEKERLKAQLTVREKLLKKISPDNRVDHDRRRVYP
jgi:hypothetical protein